MFPALRHPRCTRDAPQGRPELHAGFCRAGASPAHRPTISKYGGPGCSRHAESFQHCRHATISLEGHFSLLLLGKSRRARPDVAFRGRAGGGWGRKNEGRRRPPLEGSPPARQRRAALEDGGTDERLRSEGTQSENAWPRSKTAGGGRSRIGIGQKNARARCPGVC